MTRTRVSGWREGCGEVRLMPIKAIGPLPALPGLPPSFPPHPNLPYVAERFQAVLGNLAWVCAFHRFPSFCGCQVIGGLCHLLHLISWLSASLRLPQGRVYLAASDLGLFFKERVWYRCSFQV